MENLSARILLCDHSIFKKYAIEQINGLAAIKRIAVPIQNLKYGDNFPSISMPSLG